MSRLQYPLNITVIDPDTNKHVTVMTIRNYRNKSGKLGMMASVYSNEVEEGNYMVSKTRLRLLINHLTKVYNDDENTKPILSVFDLIPEVQELAPLTTQEAKG